MSGRRAKGRDVHGILLLDKPAAWTSNRALQQAKRLFWAAKAGHTGSLDPLATGMLPICFGAATKFAGYLLEARKTYVVVAQLGAATDTGDADGRIVARSQSEAPDLDRMHAALAAMKGEIEQIPPMYSALKRDGTRLYELARRGVVVDREPRRIRIFDAELEAYEWPRCRIRVTCSKGTYIRTWVSDLAQASGTLGYVAALKRLSVEPFEERQMVGIETLERAAVEGLDALDRLLLPVDSALSAWPRIALDPVRAAQIAHGQQVPAEADWPRGLVRLEALKRGFIGIGEVLPEGQLAPRRLLR